MTTWFDALCTFPCKGKVPMIPFSQLSQGEKAYIPPGANTGIATGTRSGIVVIDCDDHDATQAFISKYQPPDTYIVETPHGFHFYFQQPGSVRIKNSVSKLLPSVDVRGEGGLVIGIPSEGRSVFANLEPARLPDALLADLESLAPPARATNTIAVTPIDIDAAEGHTRKMRAALYLETAEPSVEGENGSGALFAVALKLMRTYELPIDTALHLIKEVYNPRCRPSWSEQEIVHKLEDARDNSDRPTGPAPEGFMEKYRAQASQPRAPDEPLVAPPGKLRKLELNEIMQTLTTHPVWKDVLGYDSMTRRPTAFHPPVDLCLEHGGLSNGDIAWIRCWFESEGAKVSVEDVVASIDAICEDHPINPFVQYLDELPVPEGPAHLPVFHEEVLNSPDGSIASAIFTKQMVAAVRRARALRGPRDEIIHVDHRVVVVLDGEQETGKSSLLRQLAGPWYGTIHGDTHDKDTKMACRGKVFVEMEEMATARKTDRNNLKAFISMQEDEYRVPYGRSVERSPRSFVLFGTSNDLVLSDPTGNTRFAVIRVGKMCGKEKLLAIRDALWWEANQLALSDFDHHLTEDEKAFCAHQAKDYEEDIVTNRLQEVLAGISFVTLTEAYDLLNQTDRKIMPSALEQGQVLDGLRRIGCEHYKRGAKRGWLVPGEISSLPMKASVSMWLKNDEAATKVREALAKHLA